MRLTIEIPDDLAKQLEPERDHLAEIIRRGLQHQVSPAAAPVEDVFEFLARRPAPEEIITFRPAEESVARLRELLERNRDGSLKPEEEAELDTLEALNDFFSLVKLQARHQMGAA